MPPVFKPNILKGVQDEGAGANHPESRRFAAAPSAEADLSVSDQRLVWDWPLAPPSELPEGQEPTIAALRTPSSEWRALSAERGGLIDTTRVYGQPVPRPRRSLTWLKTIFSSTKPQSKRVAIGWSREAWVFVNGQRVFADKNLHQPSSARKPPDGRLSFQNGSFVLALKQGNNEVAVAVANTNNFYGWGLILRLDDRDRNPTGEAVTSGHVVPGLGTRAGRIAVRALVCTATCLVFALPGMSAGPDWRRSLLASLAQWWSWGLVAPLIVGCRSRAGRPRDGSSFIFCSGFPSPPGTSTSSPPCWRSSVSNRGPPSTIRRPC